MQIPNEYNSWHYCKLIAVTQGVGEFEGLTGDDTAAVGALNCYSATDPVTLAQWATDYHGGYGDLVQSGRRYERLRRSLRAALDSGHTSIAHVTFTFAFSCSIVALKQITRRRTGVQFSVKSARYVKGDKLEEFYIPKSIMDNPEALDIYITHLEDTFERCRQLEALGIPAEDVRYIKPECILTHVVMSVNGEALLDWLKKRECFGAQDETRRLFVRILREARKVAPEVFKRAGAPCISSGFCTEGRHHYDKCPRRHNYPHVDDLREYIAEWKAAKKDAVLPDNAGD